MTILRLGWSRVRSRLRSQDWPRSWRPYGGRRARSGHQILRFEDLAAIDIARTAPHEDPGFAGARDQRLAEHGQGGDRGAEIVDATELPALDLAGNHALQPDAASRPGDEPEHEHDSVSDGDRGPAHGEHGLHLEAEQAQAWLEASPELARRQAPETAADEAAVDRLRSAHSPSGRLQEQ